MDRVSEPPYFSRDAPSAVDGAIIPKAKVLYGKSSFSLTNVWAAETATMVVETMGSHGFKAGLQGIRENVVYAEHVGKIALREPWR